MTPEQVNAQRLKIETRLNKANADLKSLQSTCTHPNVVQKHGGNTGNYDPSSDCYWIDFTCPDCDKRWTEDQ
jgi:hypothetical protein